MPEPRADLVDPRLSDREIDEQWQAIRERLEPAGPGWTGPLVWSAAAALGALLIAVPVLWLRAPGRADRAAHHGPAPVDGRTIQLPDGSRVVLGLRGQVRVAQAERARVRVRLDRGSALFSVVKNRQRAFLVEAAGWEVRVVGTVFEVRLSPKADDDAATGTARVEVSVLEGIVEVRDPRSEAPPVRLTAGQSWSAADADAGRTAGPVPGRQPSAAAVVGAEEQAPASPARLAARSRVRTGRAGRALASEDARALFDRATRLLVEGRPAEAAAALETLVHRHPRDARTPLAAFELGRLRADRLQDPAGAVAAFRIAMGSASQAGFQEELSARLVEALDRLRDVEGCRRARTAYLARFPEGPHAHRVSERCGP